MELPLHFSRRLRDRHRPGAPRRVLMLRQNFFLEEECLRAFKRLGLDVSEFQVGEALDGPKISQLLSQLVEFLPDFLFSINHIGFDKAGWLTRFIESCRLPAAVWYVDNPDFIIRAYPANVSDWVQLFVWDRHYVDGLRQMGFARVSNLPLAADDRLFRPYRRPPVEKFGRFEAAFVGSTWSQRVKQQVARFTGHPEVITAIEAAARAFQRSPNYKAGVDLAAIYPEFTRLPLAEQIDLEAAVLWRASQKDRLEKLIPLSRAGVRIFGDPAWLDVLPDPSAYGGRLSYHRELPAFYQCVDMNLNVTSLQMKDGLNQRVFDAPAAGAFLLTDYKESLGEVFEPGEVATFQDLEEARDKLKYYLGRTEARREITARARQRILAAHTYVHRVKTMCGRLEKEFFQKFYAYSLPQAEPRPAVRL